MPDHRHSSNRFNRGQLLIIIMLSAGLLASLGVLLYLYLHTDDLIAFWDDASKPMLTVTLSSDREIMLSSTPVVATLTPQGDPAITPTETLISSPTDIPPFDPLNWANLPVIPVVNSSIRDIYLKGLALGNNPNAFSKIGDCNSLNPYYLSYFDLSPSAYNLGSFTYLSSIISDFKGSFNRNSLAVGDGFNTSAVLSPLRANPDECKSGESPLDCEYRIHKPSFAIISIGTDDYLSDARYEANMRQILDTTIKNGIVPILLTKMDDANELNYNPIIAKLAYEYNVPLINLWSALRALPDHGLMDNIHPSGYTDGFNFSTTNLSRYGWPNRNLVILQALYATWQAASQETQ